MLKRLQKRVGTYATAKYLKARGFTLEDTLELLNLSK